MEISEIETQDISLNNPTEEEQQEESADQFQMELSFRAQTLLILLH